MFEQEIEMEKRSSSIVPLLLIVGLIVAIVSAALYFVIQTQKKLTPAEATSVIKGILDSQTPATVRFTTGLVKASTNDKPHDPHYRLMENAGFLKIGKDVKEKTPVTLTPKGQAFLADVVGVKTEKDKEGNDEYVVPLGRRKLVEVSKVTMISPLKAAAEYTWRWEPTKAGDLFDAAGPAVKAFNTWDRSSLIDKYGANFYHEPPTKVTLLLVKTTNGWAIATE